MGIYMYFENKTDVDGSQYLHTNVLDENLNPLISDNPTEDEKQKLDDLYNNTPIAIAMAAFDIGLKFMQDLNKEEEQNQENKSEVDENITTAQATDKGKPQMH